MKGENTTIIDLSLYDFLRVALSKVDTADISHILFIVTVTKIEYFNNSE